MTIHSLLRGDAWAGLQFNMRLRRLLFVTPTHCTLLVLLATFLCAGVRAADWPTYRHDNRRSGVTADVVSTEGLRVLWEWSSSLPPQPAWAGPAKWDAYAGLRGLKSMRMYDPVFHLIVAKDHLYFGSSSDDSVHCLDAITGLQKWQYTTDGPVRIAPSFHSGRLYFGSDDGHAYCLAAETGTLRWKFNPSKYANKGTVPKGLSHRIVHNGRFIPFWPCRSGLLVQGGTAYFSASLFPWHPSYLCAVDAINGSAKGKGCYVKPISGQTMEGAMVASDKRLIVPQGRVAPQLFERESGAGLGALKGGGGSFVVLGSDSTIFHGPGNKAGWITSSQATSGKTVATYKSGNVIVVQGNISYMLSDTGLVASDYVNRKVLWKRDCRQPYELIAAGNTLFAGGTDEIAAYDMKSGKQTWVHPVEGKVFGLVAAGGALYASTDTGHIYAFASTGKRAVASSQTKAVAATPSDPVQLDPITTIDDTSLIGHWAFQRPYVKHRNATDLAGDLSATIDGNIRLSAVQSYQALVLDGKGNRVTIHKDHNKTLQPVREMTAEAWIRVDQPRTWGGIIGAIQDNGAYERGWLLGFRKSKFSFALAGKEGPGNLTYMDATEAFVPGQWYHVVATYDGTIQRIYINGTLSTSSSAQKGDINYPPQAFYEIGAYHDKDENYLTQGMVHEVLVYRRALTSEEVLRRYRSKRLHSEPAAQLAAGPYLQFTAPSTAEIRWETASLSPTSLTYGLDDSFRTIQVPELTKHHRVTLTGLKRHRVYAYSIKVKDNDKVVSTNQFECDTFFNYERFPTLTTDSTSDAVSTIIKQNPFTRGLCLVLGSGDGSLLQDLAERTKFHVVGFSTDPEAVAAVRTRLQKAGLYGPRASIALVTSLDNLPVTRCCANLVVSQDALDGNWRPDDLEEIHRLLRPHGVAMIGLPAQDDRPPVPSTWIPWLRAKAVPFSQSSEKQLNWLKMVRPELPGAGSWSHLYGRADNSAFGGESLQDVSSTNDLVVQWIGRPGPRYQPDRNGRKPSPLSVNGRLFLQGLQRLVALDAYNGAILWSLEIPSLGRFNMPRDCGNWTADDNFLYVAIEDRLWQIDAQMGRVVHMHSVPPGARAEWDYDWGYIANVGNVILGSSVKKGTSFRSFWGGASDGWYDAKSGKATAKVCSEQIFCWNKTDHTSRWSYRGGVILNSTITATDSEVFFIENRHPTIQSSPERRVTAPQLWQQTFLVSLDLATGQKRWEQPLKTTPGTVVFYLAHSNDTLALVSSSTKNYNVYAYNSKDGQLVWDTSFPWTKDNHGGHMSRPAIVGNTLYVRPRVFELDSGSHRDLTIPGGGCGTYACTTHALFFRSGNVTVWDRLKGKTTKWSRLRPDCWLSTIPAGGMLLSPEGGGGCSCGSWMETSLGFIPKSKSK